MGALYNEIDGYAAAWLGRLVTAGHIAPGRIDTRSILDLRPADLDGVGQFHAFAGIAGWSLALRLAGVPDDAPVWTGSCPCQPFSSAGRRGGFDDARHLWPVWFDLIRQCRPAIVFGEQVEAAVRLGWLDAVFSDLEGEGYACAATVLGAHSVGAPHIRQRLWFVAYAGGERFDWQPPQLRRSGTAGRYATDRLEAAGRGEADGLADTTEGGRSQRAGPSSPGQWASEFGSSDDDAPGLMGDAAGREQRRTRQRDPSLRRELPAGGPGPWRNADWLLCRDGKARPTQPGLQPLAHGVSARVGKLRATGNAIVPQVAAAFIAAALDALPPAPVGAGRSS